MSRSLALALCLTLLAGCARPQRAFADGRAAIERRDYAAAYRHLAEIRRERPSSPEAAEAFPYAAAAFQRVYYKERFDPASAWMKTEPAFMFDWFASFCDGPDFPEAEAAALFVGLSYGFFRDYLAYAAAHPALARFHATAEDDDGIIETVTAGLH